MQATGQIALPESGAAKNKVELAGILGVMRQTICCGKSTRLSRSNSTGLQHRRLVSVHQTVPQGSEDDSGMDLRDRKMLGQCLKIEAELEILKGNWVRRIW